MACQVCGWYHYFESLCDDQEYAFLLLSEIVVCFQDEWTVVASPALRVSSSHLARCVFFAWILFNANILQCF